ncbi:hypothetical protein [Pseudanabaena sp. 'Roaring Creek']|uniref:hypothetical protein n=1 Tax=Pseudanabaena sp. 'Roaring Creek' TaxID=1681830 RepID=UPI0006D7A1C4|nr:hypothetical protein [Pseudanabaena sp. 'Roaring Creek']
MNKSKNVIDLKTIKLHTKRSQEPIAVFALLAITAWIAHFCFSSSFGFYEDDYFRINRVMEMNFSELWVALKSEVLTNGRPLHYTSIIAFSFLGNKLGGLTGIYFIAYTLFTVNCFLFYLFLKRLFDRQSFTIIGALSFCLFPVNTTQTWLAAAFGVQISMTFLLLAFHSYLGRKKLLSYLCISCCLLSYETFFFIFLTAPLLNKQWNSRQLRELFKHILILLGMIVLVVLLRKLLIKTVGVMDIGIAPAFRVSLRLMVYGSLVSMGMFILRAFDTLLMWDFRSYTVQHIPWEFAKDVYVKYLPISLMSLFLVLSNLKIYCAADDISVKTIIESKYLNIELELPAFCRHLLKLMTTGILMVILSYPLSLTMSPFTLTGRDTRIHLPASIGISIISACVFSILIYLMDVYKKRLITSFGLSIFFTLLIGFGLIVQHDYRISWQYQQAFWTDVMRLAPDLEDGTKILVEDPRFKSPQQITANAWYVSLILDQIYKFPKDWKNPPNLHLVPLKWYEYALSQSNLFDLNSRDLQRQVNRVGFPNFVSDENYQFPSSNVIVLASQNGKLVRQTTPLIVGDRTLPLKQLPTNFTPLEKSNLYNYLRVDEINKIEYLEE